MTVQEAIQARHSVRAYKNEPLADDVVKALEEQIAVLKNNCHQIRAKKGFSMIGYTKMDLGIAKYHFEIGAGKVNFGWV